MKQLTPKREDLFQNNSITEMRFKRHQRRYQNQQQSGSFHDSVGEIEATVQFFLARRLGHE